eukprot:880972-Alexandrium_andersonii.AAC.1
MRRQHGASRPSVPHVPLQRSLGGARGHPLHEVGLRRVAVAATRAAEGAADVAASRGGSAPSGVQTFHSLASRISLR